MAGSSNKPTKAKAKRPKRATDTMSGRPRGSQRERLVEAMIDMCAEVGYQATSIAEVSTRAGVSSATFYEQFSGKEDCLVAAYHTASERLFGQLGLLLAQGDWSDGGRRLLVEVTDAIRSDPNAGRLLLIESLGGGGEQLLTERKGLVSTFERLTQTFVDRTAPDGRIFDIPVLAVMGGLRHEVARQLRGHSEDLLPTLVDPGLSWLATYSAPAGSGRWSTSPSAMLPAQQVSAPMPAPAPPKLPRGRHGLPAGVVARSRRTRILYATAEVTMAKGYANVTVADIVAHAKVARDVFYEHFEDKEHAFLEAQDFPTQHILDTCVSAYFSGEDWPERVWRAMKQLCELIRDNPAISHLRLVEAYAAGPKATRRAEEITRSFTIFLEEGYRYHLAKHGEEPPRLFGRLTSGGIFEIVQRQAARGQMDSLVQYVPLLTYIALAPFTGAEEAAQLVEQIAARANEPSDDSGKRPRASAASVR